MTNRERWQRVKHVLAVGLELPHEGRAGLLDEACAGDAALRAEVESLLAADAGSGVLDSRVATLADEESGLMRATRLAAGARLGPYEIVAFLGAGSMGEVYRARDTQLGREVAVKALHAEAGGDAERRFDDEARAASALNHPNIVTVYDVGAEGGLRYVVSELLAGATLRARLERGPLSLDDCLSLGRQIAAGLAAAHDQGIVHRDLKPENLFLTRDGRIKTRWARSATCPRSITRWCTSAWETLLGNVLHVGLFDEARALYERAEALSPGHPRARTHVVMCLAAQGRHEEAVAYGDV